MEIWENQNISQLEFLLEYYNYYCFDEVININHGGVSGGDICDGKKNNNI